MEEARAAGRLNTLSPKGLFATHLLDCPQCVDAELAGFVNVQCEAHTLVALMRGAWGVPGKGKQLNGHERLAVEQGQAAAACGRGFFAAAAAGAAGALGVIDYEAPSSQQPVLSGLGAGL